MKVVFFGTPDFAASALESLLANPRFEVVAAVTQPDREVGRRKTLTSPPVKAIAEKRGVKVFQPERLKEEKMQDEILSLKPELAVVVAYGNLIPKRMLDAVPRGFVNLHPSLLPKHRGAAPISATILEGDEEAGICLMELDEQMDHGPVIACRRTKLDGTETSASLRAKLAPVGAEMLNSELIEYLDGKIVPQPQKHEDATFCRQLESADARIDWSKGADRIERLVRAMHGVTPAWTELDGKTLLVHTASVAVEKPTEKAGTVVEIRKTPAVAAEGGYLLLDEVQPAGGKAMSGQAFLNGHRQIIGKRLA